jgi:pimeloyl-ACP methyl ester carboxylesterase
MATVHVTEWDLTGGAGAPAVLVHNIFTWGDDETYGFAAQRPLADQYRLLLVDRRGYGQSPDIARSDFETDAADLVEVLQEVEEADDGRGGAHLVGHGNGGLAAMLAAAWRPDLVRSLTLIQPAAFSAAADHPVVAEMLEMVKDFPGVPESVTPEHFLRASTEGLGMDMPEPTPQRLRAVTTSMRERPIWEARTPVEPLREAAWPTLVICGTWHDAPKVYRRYAGEALVACAEVVAESIGARLLSVPGYYPQTQQADAVNRALREFWADADASTDADTHTDAAVTTAAAAAARSGAPEPDPDSDPSSEGAA